MKIKITVLILYAAVLFGLCLPAHAQTRKIFRIGFLDASTASGSAVRLEAFRQELRKLGGLKEKTSPSNIGLQSKSVSAYLSLPRTWFV